MRVRPLPLRLTLEPLIPDRTPCRGGSFEYGYRLRLPKGPLVADADPLLAAFAAAVEWVHVPDEQDEALQSDSFDPGRPVRFVPEPFDPDDPTATGVWDDDGLRQAGTLPVDAAAVTAAAAEAGLEHRGIVLREYRAATDDRREHVVVLVYAPALVRIAKPSTPQAARPARSARPRLVLVADDSGDVRWWDPSASTGPLTAGDLPLSHELRRELERLREAFVELAGSGDERRGLDRMDHDFERAMLHGRAADLWRRARTELGRRYAVGFLGAGMRRPVWSPSELEDDDDEIPF